MPYTIRAAVEGLPTVALQSAAAPLPGDQSELAYLLGATLTKALLASGVPPTNLFAQGALRVRLDLVRNEDLDKPRPVIKPASVTGSHRQYEVSHRFKPEDVERMLGFPPGPGDGEKVQYEFGFTVDGEPCALWDWHGHLWSAWGSREALAKVFGVENVL